MAERRRVGHAVWNGNLLEGKGSLGVKSGALEGVPYDFKMRFEEKPGTNPEELIAAAHAGCFNMAFAHTLAEKGYSPKELRTKATSTLSPLEEGGFKISRMRLEVRGQVAGLDDSEFAKIAQEAEAGCPVSNALRGNVAIEVDAALE